MSLLIKDWLPSDARGPNTNMAVLLPFTENGDPNPVMDVLWFGGSNYIADFYGFVPPSFGNGDLHCDLWWRTEYGVEGGLCLWNAELKCVTPSDDLMGKAFGAVVQVSATAPDEGKIARIRFAFDTPAKRDNIAGLDALCLRVMRLQAPKGNLAANAGFMGAMLFEG